MPRQKLIRACKGATVIDDDQKKISTFLMEECAVCAAAGGFEIGCRWVDKFFLDRLSKSKRLARIVTQVKKTCARFSSIWILTAAET